MQKKFFQNNITKFELILYGLDTILNNFVIKKKKTY